MHRALVEAQAIPTCAATQNSKSSGKETVSDDFRRCKWGRAARTDKGVSAAGQVVAFDMALKADMASRLNAVLPDQILVYGFKCAAHCPPWPDPHHTLPCPEGSAHVAQITFDELGHLFKAFDVNLASLSSCLMLQAGRGAV